MQQRMGGEFGRPSAQVDNSLMWRWGERVVAWQSIDARTYYEAALEQDSAARLLYNDGNYALSFYVAGLSIECILRSFISQSSVEFDEKHDLRKLFKRSKFAESVSEAEAYELQGVLNQVILRWENLHRFRSENALRRFLKHSKFDRQIKGDFVKENCRIVVEAAFKIVKRGAFVWRI